MKKSLLLLLALIVSFCASAAVTDTITVEGRYLDKPMRVTVITPDNNADSAATFPTVYLLNGYGGDYTSWGTIQPDLPKLADQYGMVLVMPSGMDSWYWDSPINPGMQMESFFINELVPYIDANFPTIPTAEKRAIMGLSMGGHGGLWLGIRHSDVFGSAGSTSGGVNILPFTERWKMKQSLGEYKDNPQRWQEHTVINLVPQLKPGQLNIIFDCGIDDFFSDVNAELHRALVEAKIPHDYISRPGNHSAKYWRNSVLYQLLYFNEIFNGRGK